MEQIKSDVGLITAKTNHFWVGKTNQFVASHVACDVTITLGGWCICASTVTHTSLVHNPPMLAPYVKATDCITVVVLL